MKQLSERDARRWEEAVDRLSRCETKFRMSDPGKKSVLWLLGLAC